MSVSLINGHIDRGSMTPQEALAWVEDYEKAIKEEQAIVNNGDEFHVEALKVCEVVKQALEKQIPKKVTHEASIFKCCTCPNCKNVVDEFTHFNGRRVRVIYNNCKFCGQALDWSDTE
ncbi:MAG: hypothetical protein J6A49_10720 [Clostridia bacterium]|nr:hypothetical protein [Clostridia bacterium]